MAKDINVDVKVTGLGDLRAQLKAAREDVIALQNADVIDPQAIAQATQRAGELRDRLNDANEQIKIMSGGTDFEKASAGLSLIGDQLSNLDFEGAANTAKGLTGVIQGMDPQSVAKGFGDLTKTVGQLGNAFFQMGLKLLANPIFLLVAIIAGVVAAIVMLKDKVKIVEQAFDILMIPIKALIQGLKDLTDWLGITQFAEEEAAEASLQAAEKRAAASKKFQGDIEKDFSRRIALAKAEGKNTEQLEIQKSKIVQQESAKRVASYNAEIAKQRELLEGQTREEQKSTKEKIAKLRQDRDQDLQVNRDAENEIKVIKAQAAREANEEAAKKRQQDLEDQKRRNREKLAEEKRLRDEMNAIIRARAERAQELEGQSYQNIQVARKANEDALKTQRQRELDDVESSYNKQIELAKSFGQSTVDLEAAKFREMSAIRTKFDEEQRAKDAAEFERKNTEAINDLNNNTVRFEERYAILAQQEQLLKDNTTLNEEERKRIEEQNSQARIQIAQAELAAKTATLTAIGDALGGFTELVGKETAAGKALAIAQATISAYTGIANVWGAPSPYPEPYGTAVKIASTVAVATSAFANIKKIISTKVPGRSDSGGSAPSGGPGGSAPAVPATVLRGASSTDNVASAAQTVVQPQQNITVNAVVSETQVTSTQNRVAQMQRNAEL